MVPLGGCMLLPVLLSQLALAAPGDDLGYPGDAPIEFDERGVPILDPLRSRPPDPAEISAATVVR